jgi:hypothetical protein
VNRYLQYLSIAFSLAFIWETLRQTRAIDPATSNLMYQAVAEQILARPKVQRVLDAMDPTDADATRAGLPGSLRLLDALTE